MPEAANEAWSKDLMHDHLGGGPSFRMLNVLDDFNRQRLAMEVTLPTQWLWTYDHERPSMALGGITPMQKLSLAAYFTSGDRQPAWDYQSFCKCA